MGPVSPPADGVREEFRKEAEVAVTVIDDFEDGGGQGVEERRRPSEIGRKQSLL